MKLGIIGAGFISRFHAIALTQVRGWDVAGVFSPEGSEDLCAFVRSKGVGQPKVFSTVAELANHVDVLAIFSPNPTRVATMEEIVEQSSRDIHSRE